MKRITFLSLMAVALPFIVGVDTISAAERCQCAELHTATFVRVGATCERAIAKAKADAIGAAVCPPASEGTCGPTFTVSRCTMRPEGGFEASSVSAFYCEFCIEPIDLPPF